MIDLVYPYPRRGHLPPIVLFSLKANLHDTTLAWGDIQRPHNLQIMWVIKGEKAMLPDFLDKFSHAPLDGIGKQPTLT